MLPLILIASLLAAPAVARAQAADAPLAPELTGLGNLHMAVTTSVPRAQRFFDQGLRLLYAFNHPESIRAFREAARLDPNLAMAYWGQAIALGPNLNAPMTPENAALALEAIQRARAVTTPISARERALIAALATRYSADPAADRKELDRAYASAMRDVAAQFPDDPDVLTLYADAIMNVSPWDYYEKNGSAKPLPAQAIAALERALAKHPNHAGALHYHIHALEASNEPQRAEQSADRLGPLMPAAGHMVHMPAHIYIRVGRYKDAAEANVRAIAADEDYLTQCAAQGLYPVSYYPHNLHFLWAASTLEGRRAAAIDAARETAAKVPHHHAGKLAWTADFPVTPLLAYARFGAWREILTEPQPPAHEPYANGIWHYARALAFVARRELDRAETELAALHKLMEHEAFKTTLKETALPPNLQIAWRMASGELHARAERKAEAVRILEEAVAIEDEMPYSEPPLWHHPPRQVLGAVLIEAGRFAEAEAVYREDLKRFPENGWSLFGLTRSLEAQGKAAEAAAVKARFDRAWQRADITLTSSRIIDEVKRVEAAGMKAESTAAGYSPKEITLATGATLEYVQQGDPSGTPVVLLHGITDSWRSFAATLPHLPQSLNVYAVSMRGHGRSSRPDGGYRTEDFARDIDAFIGALGHGSAVIVGHSLGSAVALRLAVDHPTRVRKLVLIGAAARWDARPDIVEFVKHATTLSDPIDPAFVRSFQEGTAAKPIEPAFMDMAIGESLRVPARVWREAFGGVLHADVSRQLGTITVPTLLIWGDRETIVPREQQDALVNGIPRARLLVYEGHGHAVHWEDPARVARDIAGFVAPAHEGH